MLPWVPDAEAHIADGFGGEAQLQFSKDLGLGHLTGQQARMVMPSRDRPGAGDVDKSGVAEISSKHRHKFLVIALGCSIAETLQFPIFSGPTSELHSKEPALSVKSFQLEFTEQTRCSESTQICVRGFANAAEFA